MLWNIRQYYVRAFGVGGSDIGFVGSVGSGRCALVCQSVKEPPAVPMSTSWSILPKNLSFVFKYFSSKFYHNSLLFVRLLSQCSHLDQSRISIFYLFFSFHKFIFIFFLFFVCQAVKAPLLSQCRHHSQLSDQSRISRNYSRPLCTRHHIL